MKRKILFPIKYDRELLIHRHFASLDVDSGLTTQHLSSYVTFNAFQNISPFSFRWHDGRNEESNVSHGKEKNFPTDQRKF